ncbi:hypothetical protein [Saccharothrix syringae]|uniref:Uncharacterized protein n=1 Tax=Saccharothrix syringae TaxID=103733 RepID=A0A5Q0HBR9_SACSY|nr:hypothetical protein [Saccharothrix syringae]QFZ23395.1 hypothetical protein EKG83_43480 [Saccharothrix syringae]
MEIGEPERPGTHRLEDGAAIWLPMGGELDHLPAVREPDHRGAVREADRPRAVREPDHLPAMREGGRRPAVRGAERPPAEQPPAAQPPTAQLPTAQLPTAAPPKAQPPTAQPPEAAPPKAQDSDRTAAERTAGETAAAHRATAARAADRPPAPPATDRRAVRERPGFDHPPPLPPQRTRDPLTDSDAVGLRKFNIGLVPASVTPPRTWKRAAWFAVLSSAGVLVGLALAASKLVGSNNPVERVGMPGYPADVPLLTGFATTPPPPTTAAPTPSRPDHPGGPAGLRAPTAEQPAAGGATSTARTTTGATAPAEPALSPPEVVTVPHAPERPAFDGVAIASRTERFFEEAVRNADTAMALVSDSFRSSAEALLERDFAGVSLVEVSAIEVDPGRGVTISTLQLVRRDGTRVTERRELGFTAAGVPLINAERLAGGV